MIADVGSELALKLREKSLDIYSKAAEHAKSRGILIADTKFEFGLVDEEIVLIDEVLTPDSSRFWDASIYAPGAAQPSFDKQFCPRMVVTVRLGQTERPARAATGDHRKDRSEISGSLSASRLAGARRVRRVSKGTLFLTGR